MCYQIYFQVYTTKEPVMFLIILEKVYDCIHVTDYVGGQMTAMTN